MRIRNFLHKGLKRLYLEDNAKGLPTDAADKLRAMLTFLQDMRDPNTLKAFPLWRARSSMWITKTIIRSNEDEDA